MSTAVSNLDLTGMTTGALQAQVNALKRKLDQLERENRELTSKLRKYEKSNKSNNNSNINTPKSSRLSGRSKFDQAPSIARMSDEDNEDDSDDDGRKSRRSMKSITFAQQETLTVEEADRRRFNRNNILAKESNVNVIQADCLRKCNQYLALLVGDYDKRWDRFQEISIMKNDQTILCSRILLNQLQPNEQFQSARLICQISLQDSMEKYKSAVQMYDEFEKYKEDILLAVSINNNKQANSSVQGNANKQKSVQAK